MPEQFADDVRDQSTLDRWLETEFTAQYNQQLEALKKVGLIETLPESLEMGFVGIDNKEYPIPTKEVIIQEIKNNKEVYETKLAQGFTEIQLTLFAIPLDVLITTLERQLIKHHQEGKLLAPKADPADPDESLELDYNHPLSFWEKWRDSDRDGSCIYYPTSFDKTNHGGHTKAEILKAQSGSPLDGWNVLLIESNPNIPRTGKGKTIGKRKQIEAGQTPEGYLIQLQTDLQYAHEIPLTNEDWLTRLISHLEETNQIVDEFRDKGSACYLLGSFKLASFGVGIGYWTRNLSQANLYVSNVRNDNLKNGLRTAVGVGRKVTF